MNKPVHTFLLCSTKRGAQLTNQIPFSKNHTLYLQKAMEALANNQNSQAVDFMQKALEIDEDETLLQLCISLLKDLKRPNDALQLIQKYKVSVYKSEDSLPFDLEFISLLIENGNLEEASRQIKNRQSQLKNSANQVLTHQFTYVESRMAQEKQEKRLLIIENGQTISKQPYYRQLQFMKELPYLSNYQLVSLVGILLTNLDIHPLVKTDMLELLQERQIKQAVTVIKHSFKQTFDPMMLTNLSETNFIKEGGILLENHLHLNEREKSQYLELLFLHVAYYYPFEKLAFKNPETWLHTILSPETNLYVEKIIRQAEKGLDSLMT